MNKAITSKGNIDNMLNRLAGFNTTLSNDLSMVSSATGQLNEHVTNAVLALQSEDLNRQKLEQTITQLNLLEEITSDAMAAFKEYELEQITYEELTDKIQQQLNNKVERAESAEINTVYSKKVTDVDAGEVELF